MRPGFKMPTSFNDPGPGLHSMTPYSLYIPSAGFLWSDHLVWEPETGSFMTENTFLAHHRNGTQEDEEVSSSPYHRIIMKDPFGRFTPWILQKDLSHSLHNGLEQELLLNKEPVVLRSVQSKEFLAVLPEISFLEAQMGLENATETGRYAVA